MTLAEQDRSLWDHSLVAEGTALLDSTIGTGRGPGEYQVQAAIAAVHDRAATADDTDWPQVLALYGLLEEVAPSPFVTLARAVALAEAEGPDAAAPCSTRSRRCSGTTSGCTRCAVTWPSCAATGPAARRHYLAAAARATNLAEQRHLTRLAAGLAEPPGPDVRQMR